MRRFSLKSTKKAGRPTKSAGLSVLSDCEDIIPVSYIATLMSYVATLMSYVITLMSYIASLMSYVATLMSYVAVNRHQEKIAYI